MEHGVRRSMARHIYASGFGSGVRLSPIVRVRFPWDNFMKIDKKKCKQLTTSKLIKNKLENA
jgi:hypothetical protein